MSLKIDYNSQNETSLTLKPDGISKQDELEDEKISVQEQRELLETGVTFSKNSQMQLIDDAKMPVPNQCKSQADIILKRNSNEQIIEDEKMHIQEVDTMCNGEQRMIQKAESYVILKRISNLQPSDDVTDLDQGKMLKAGSELLTKGNDAQLVDGVQTPASNESEIFDQKQNDSVFSRPGSHTSINQFKPLDSPQSDCNSAKDNDAVIPIENPNSFGGNQKIKSSFILNCLQHGIKMALQNSSQYKQRVDLLMSDFTAVQVFNLHLNKGAFVFRVYAPMAFSFFRDIFGITTEDFVKSISHEPLHQTQGCGSSGSDMYVTQDNRFILKTTTKREANFLISLFPGYYLNLSQHPKTLLPKYFGLFCYLRRNKKIRILVVNNVLPYTTSIMEIYDIKGATNRKIKFNEIKMASAASNTVVLKDLDFLELRPDGLFIRKDMYDLLMKSIEKDCLVLQSYGIMDYSLVLGVYSHDGDHRISPFLSQETEHRLDGSADEENSQLDEIKIANLIGPFNARTSRGDEVSLHVGIIDILQSYTMGKKMEHYVRSLVSAKSTISVSNPEFYSLRLQSFLKKSVFKSVPNLDTKKFV